MGITLPGTASGPGHDPHKARKWRLFWSYLPDWCLTIFLWGMFYLIDKIDGYRRLFDINDTSLAHPYADPDRIPVWLLAIICGIIPALAMILISALYRRSFWDVHSAILGFVLALGLTITITNIVKVTVGRPRPDLFGRCQLPEDLTSNPVHGLTSWEACTQTDLLQDGFRSFPSGHSSFAWAGMWYFILYLCAKMRISNKRGYTVKAWILLAPLMCAILVGVSRTMDYRHHATDVIAGGIIGILGAWFAYRQYYPPIAAPQSYKPYSPRIPAPGKETEGLSLPLHRTHSSKRDHDIDHHAQGHDQAPLRTGAAGPSVIGGAGTGIRPSEERLSVGSGEYEMNGQGQGYRRGQGQVQGLGSAGTAGSVAGSAGYGHGMEGETVQRPGKYD